jgi:hypothetical protein
MHKKEANKSILKVGFIVIGVIVLFAVLFSISPRDKAVAGQAILTEGSATVNGFSPSGNTVEFFRTNVVSNLDTPPRIEGASALLTSSQSDYVILPLSEAGGNIAGGDPGNYVCPPGQNLIKSSSGHACLYSGSSGSLYLSGWVIVDLRSPVVLTKKLVIRAKNAGDGCDMSTVFCDNNPNNGDDSTSFRVFVTNNFAGIDTVWIPLPDSIGGQNFFFSLPRVNDVRNGQISEIIVPVNHLSVGAILIARGDRGTSAPDPRIYSVNVIEGCAPNGIVDSTNDRICINNEWSVGLSCAAEGKGAIHPENRAYCKEESLSVLKWASDGSEVSTRFYSADGILNTRVAAVPGYCPGVNNCVGNVPSPVNRRCFANEELYPSNTNVCINGNWYTSDKLGTILNNKFVVLNIGDRLNWQDGLDCPTQGQVQGQAICRSTPTSPSGRRASSTATTRLQWTDCNAAGLEDTVCIANRAEVCNAQTENRRSTDNQYYCSGGRWTLCNAERLGEGVDNSGNAYQNTFVCSTNTAGNVVTYSWQPTTCGPPGRPSTTPGPSCAGAGPGDCIGSSILNVGSGEIVSLQEGLVGHYAYEYLIDNDLTGRFLGCATNDGCVYDDGVATTNDFYAIDDITENLNVPDLRNGIEGRSFDLNDDDDPDFDLNNDGSINNDDDDENVNLVCGRGNSWLFCYQGGVLIPSDGGKYMCNFDEGEYSWLECDQTLSGRTLGNFVCTQVQGRWQWFSQFACSPSSRYVVRGSGTNNPEICDGDGANSKFVGCLEIDDTFNDPTASVYDANVLVSCADLGTGRTIYANETGALACFNREDDDKDGAVDCSDSDCNSVNVYSVTNLFTSKGRSNTMVRLQANSCGAVNLNQPSNPDFTNLRLCDTGTTDVATHATICYDNNQQVQVPSVEFLNRDAQSTMLTVNGLTFVYFEPTGTDQKKVDVFNASLDLLNYQVDYPLNQIATPMVNGQNLLFRVGREYYLASYPATQRLFNVANIMIKDLSRRTDHVAQNYIGTNDYVFDIQGDNQIVMGVVNGILRVRSQPTAEILAGRPTTKSTNNNFEVKFSKRAPVYINERLSVFSVCRQDVDATLEEAILCINNTQIATFRRGYLTELRPFLEDRQQPNDPANNMKYAFLYEYNGSDKVISIFNVTDMDDAQVNVNGETIGNFTYANYINSLIAGRRAAIKFGGKLYLATHPVRSTFSQRDVVMKAYVNGQTTDFTGSGSEALVEYALFDGVLSVERSYGFVPPLPFVIRGVSSDVLRARPFDLREQLSTVMSSETARSVTAPINYGVISQGTTDNLFFEDSFRLTSVGSPDFARLTLGGTYERPAAVPAAGRYAEMKTLFYYHTARAIGTSANPNLLKSVAIYLLYELDSPKFHPFTSSFVRTFTQGKVISLQFGNSYYLLSYLGPADGSAQSFTVRNLRLSTLDGVRTFTPDINGLVARFTGLTEGDIQVEVVEDNVNGDRLVFRTIGERQLLTQTLSDEDYMIPITTTSLVNYGEVTLDMCNQDDYVGQAANICYVSPRGGDRSIEVGEPTLLTLDHDDNPATAVRHFLLETNGRTGNAKVVFLRRLININANEPLYSINRWSLFAGNVTSGFGPVFNVSGDLYLPGMRGSELNGFTLSTFPGGLPRYPVRTESIKSFSSISKGGNMTLGDDLITVRQTVNDVAVRDQYVQATMRYSPLKFVYDDRREILFNTTGALTAFNFVTDVEGTENGFKVFTLQRVATPVSSSLVRFRLLDNRGVRYFERYFGEGDTRVVRLGNVLVEMNVPKINYNANGNFEYAHVTIKRK